MRLSVRFVAPLAATAAILAFSAAPSLAWARSAPSAKGKPPKAPVASTAAATDAAASPSPKTTGKRAARGKKTEHTGPFATMPGFTMRPDGTSVIFVDLTAPPQIEEHAGRGFVTYVLKDTEVDRANNKNPLETAFYDTPVLRARLRSVKKEPDAELAIELRADVKPTYKVITEKGLSRLEVSFPAGKFAKADFDGDLPSQRAPRTLRDESRDEGRGTHGKKSAKGQTGKGGKKASGAGGGSRDDGRKGPKTP
jgi:hypothetical protein